MPVPEVRGQFLEGLGCSIPIPPSELRGSRSLSSSQAGFGVQPLCPVVFRGALGAQPVPACPSRDGSRLGPASPELSSFPGSPVPQQQMAKPTLMKINGGDFAFPAEFSLLFGDVSLLLGPGSAPAGSCPRVRVLGNGGDPSGRGWKWEFYSGEVKHRLSLCSLHPLGSWSSAVRKPRISCPTLPPPHFPASIPRFFSSSWWVGRAASWDGSLALPLPRGV